MSSTDSEAAAMGASSAIRTGPNGVVLFDIDNTLLYTGGAGTAALTEAFARIYGIDDGFAGTEFHGRTDLAILRDGLRFHKLIGDGDDHDLGPLIDAYLRSLDEKLQAHEGHLKPGIPELLDALLDADMTLGIATGNLREGAVRKLRYYGLDRYFNVGGFGDDVLERADMVKAAVAACGIEGCAVIVVGDTPGDVQSAKANGAIAVGVATGAYAIGQLVDAGADLVFSDLGDVSAVTAAFQRIAANAGLAAR